MRNRSHEQKMDPSNDNYGLNWLGKSYARSLAKGKATTVLTEDKAWNKKAENRLSRNLLIKGDNLEVLKHLSGAYREKIRMIYLDPPYNTGNDGFVYQDTRRFSNDELRELAGENTGNAKHLPDPAGSKSNAHSAWLTFMYPRLYLARQLLTDDGVIFVSIDDNEVAQLRLLMDEIFGEENFTGTFVWQTKNAARGVPPRNMLMENHEYILAYAKNKEHHSFIGIERDKADFSNPDDDPRGLWRSESIRATGLQNNYYTIINPETRDEFYGNWAFSEATVKKMIADDLIIFPRNKEGTPRQKKFINAYVNDKKAFVTSLGWYSTENSTKYLMGLFDNRKIFDFPKPVALIKFLAERQTAGDDLILDFFAGSGTTGDAVMQLNAENGGHRRYILVQLPEPLDPKKNKNAYEFVKDELKIDKPSIFEITKERLLRAGKKIKEDHQDLPNIDTGFKIFEATPVRKSSDFEIKDPVPTMTARRDYPQG
jgi:adenine-specific DNA-methyltransferase